MERRDEVSPIYGVAAQDRFKLQEAAGRAIGAITAFRQHHERTMELIAAIGEDLGATPEPLDPAQKLDEINARLGSRLDQLEALRGELADLLVDAPAFVDDRPLYTDRVAPELDDLPVVAGGGKVTDLPLELRPIYLLKVHKWMAEQNAKLIRTAVTHLRAVVELLASVETEAARKLEERCIAAIRALGMKP